MRALAAVLASVLLAACGPDVASPQADAPAAPEPSDSAEAATEADLPPREPFGTATIQLVAPGGRRVDMPVYVADHPAAHRQGLMGVTDLPREAGMVFLYPETRQGGFWMKDTLLPLSIAFFAAGGDILAVLDMDPCEADPCPVYDPGVTYRHALEVHQGRFEEVGLDESWAVQLPPELQGCC